MCVYSVAYIYAGAFDILAYSGIQHYIQGRMMYDVSL